MSRTGHRSIANTVIYTAVADKRSRKPDPRPAADPNGIPARLAG
jgi:hypothetical protein